MMRPIASNYVKEHADPVELGTLSELSPAPRIEHV